MSIVSLAPQNESSGRALQDVIKLHCFGCGTLNERGLQIKSRWAGDDLVCRWRPKPFHIGYPGIVYGGAIASIVDCHAIWTALASCCRDNGFALEDGPPPFAFVTGKLSVNYLKPAAIEHEIELRARVTNRAERRYTVACRVLQQGVECANAEVLAVRVRPMS